MPETATPRMKITLDLDEEQLGILMNVLESTFEMGGSEARRSEASFEDALDRAARTWEPGACTGFEYQVAKIAPVYRQFLANWKQPDTQAGGAYDTEDRAEFAAALAEARKPLPPAT